MTYTTWKITHTPVTEGIYGPEWNDEDETELTSYYDPRIKLGLGETKNTFAFKVINFNNNYDNFFQPEDRISIYRVINSDTVTTEHLLMEGTIKDIPTQEDFNNKHLRIEGNDFTETILNGIAFVDSADRTIPEVFQEALAFINRASPNFGVAWDDDNPDEKTIGGAFPTTSERIFYQPMRQIMEKYSTSQATEDEVSYYYYVTRDKKLIWKPRDTSNSKTLDLTTVPCKLIKTAKDVSKIKNFVVIKGGIDPAGNPIQDFYQDVSSITKHGLKFHILISNNTKAKDLVDIDRSDDFGEDKPYSTEGSYPDITSAAYTTKWKSPLSDNVKVSILGSTVTITKNQTITIDQGSESANKKAYNAIIRAVVKHELQQEARAYVDMVRYGKLKVDLELPVGQVTWGLGDNINVNLPVIKDVPILMRVNEIEYGTDTDILSLEEDKGTL
jgi:hypothetical protein